MKIPNVYFYPTAETDPDKLSPIARKVFERIITEKKIELEKNPYLKIHPGEPGNITYTRPQTYNGIIDCLQEKGLTPSFIETNTVTGKRTNKLSHLKVVKEHGFDRIPFIVADGETGEDHIEMPVKKGRHFQTAKIAKILAGKNQVIVLSHFKGHIASGFGAAVKMLGIGFASRRGKIIQHTREKYHSEPTINWSLFYRLHWGDKFIERVADYALAASAGKKHIFLNFAINLVKDCDCDARPMEPLYPNLGIFASTDPVAIDKACMDQLQKRENKKPFKGEHVFGYAQEIGLGSAEYSLIEIA